MLAARARAIGSHICYVNGVGGQDELVFDGQSVVFDADGCLVARARQFEEQLLVVDLAGASRGRWKARCPGKWPIEVLELPCAQAALSSAAPHTDGASASGQTSLAGLGASSCLIHEALSLEGELYQALCLGVRDYTDKNRFKAGRHRHQRRHRFGPHRLHRRRRAGGRPGQHRVDAVALLEQRHQERRARDGRAAGRALLRDTDRVDVRDLPRGAGRVPRSGGAGRHRAEHPGPHPRQPADGALQQVRLAGAHHRQQERDGGRLRHPLRRHGGRLRRAQGRAQDPGVPAVRVSQLARPGEGPIPQSTIVRAPSAELAADQTDQDTLPPYEILDRIIEAYVVRTTASRRSRPPASTRRRCSAWWP